MKSPWFSLNHISHLAIVEIRVVRLGSFQNLYLSFAIVEITHGVTANRDDVDIMIFIECYPLKRCQSCVKLIASKVNCFLNITDLSEVQLCMSSNSWTWECPHTKDGADHVPLICLNSVYKMNTVTHNMNKKAMSVFSSMHKLGFYFSSIKHKIHLLKNINIKHTHKLQ